MSTERKKMGRPAGQDYPHLLHVRISDDMRDALERVRKARLDQPTATALIRELLAKGLSAEAASVPREPEPVPARAEPPKPSIFNRKG